MEIHDSSSVREVLRAFPGVRGIFEQYGLDGCGGPEGPEEPLSVFARAHGVEPGVLVTALRQLVNAAPRPPAPAPAAASEPASENYRYYLKTAVLIGMLAGAALGAINLTWIAAWGLTGQMPHWEWWPALVQAHGNAQLYGWCGLFILGIAGHSLPRMLQRPAPAPWLARAVFGLLLSGILLDLIAQPLAARPGFGAAYVAAMLLQWAGVSLFAGYLARTIRVPREPYLGFITAGGAWLWLAASARVLLSLAAAA
ncbi:MAG TPA: hypothetical protein VFU47_02300, partial [Armatimonadota bacterium]|nr:hypothetical protein [Armatimonadota bacterium]